MSDTPNPSNWHQCIEEGCAETRERPPGPRSHSRYICPSHRPLYRWEGMRWVRKEKPEAMNEPHGEPCSDDSPWPMDDVLFRLCEAADILLDSKDYDGHGHELIAGARRVAREFLKQNTKEGGQK